MMHDKHDIDDDDDDDDNDNDIAHDDNDSKVQ